MHVSVADDRLASAAHTTVAEGLSDLGLSRLQLSVSETGEAPKFDLPAQAYVYVGHEAGARTYRAHLYELEIRVSAVHLPWGPLRDLGDEEVQWTANVARGAGILGARVAVLDAFSGAAEDTSTDPETLVAASGSLLARTVGSNITVGLRHGVWSWARDRVLRDVLREIEEERLGIDL